MPVPVAVAAHADGMSLLSYVTDTPGGWEVHRDVREDTGAGTWPEPFTRATAAGEMPAYPECAEVTGTVIAERMKLADLAAIRVRKDDHRLPTGVLR